MYAGMDQTRLEFGDWRGKMMYAVNVSRVTIRDLHLTRSSPGTTQGFVTRVQPGKVSSVSDHCTLHWCLDEGDCCDPRRVPAAQPTVQQWIRELHPQPHLPPPVLHSAGLTCASPVCAGLSTPVSPRW